MDVPELVAMVAQYLEPTDLKACALVCRAWYNSFNPYVWSTFVLNGVPEQDPPCCCSSSSPSAPSVISSSSSSVPTLWATTTEDCQIHPRCCKKQAVYKNASFIRHLVVRYVDPSWHPEEFYALFTEKCNSLRSLSLIVDSIYQEYISCLLRANPRVAEHVSHFLMPDLSGQSSLEPPHSKVVTIGDVDE
ncbi:hypothetical protein BGW41_001366 [Actinomortierella wolfii]|nr:hypothetical protein BGW41_001366 [Actinomortierella wolfii]